MLEAHRKRVITKRGELFWRVVTNEWEVLHRWAQVLPNGQDVAVNGAKVAEGGEQLLALLPKPNHDRTLRVYGVAELTRHLFRARQHLQRAVVACTLAHWLLQPLNRLHIVVKDVWSGLHDCTERSIFTVKVRDEHFNSSARCEATELANALRKDRGAAIREIVTRHARDHHMVKVE